MNISTDLRLLALTWLLAVASCASRDAASLSATSESDAVATAAAAPDASDPATLQGAGPWTVTATDGTDVTLSTDAAPFVAGPVVLTVSVRSASGDAVARSIDLVSPTMPMHGLVRYPLKGGETRFEIPMEGRWAIYVNLDEDGATSAEFLFDVALDGGGGHEHFGAPAMTMEGEVSAEDASTTHRSGGY